RSRESTGPTPPVPHSGRRGRPQGCPQLWTRSRTSGLLREKPERTQALQDPCRDPEPLDRWPFRRSSYRVKTVADPSTGVRNGSRPPPEVLGSTKGSGRIGERRYAGAGSADGV